MRFASTAVATKGTTKIRKAREGRPYWTRQKNLFKWLVMNIIQHIAAMTARPCCNAHEQNSAIQHTNSYETWICLFDAWRKVTTYFPKRCFFWWSSMLECKKQHKQNIQIQGNVSISWVHFYCNIPHLPAFWPQPIKNQWAVDFEKNKKNIPVFRRTLTTHGEGHKFFLSLLWRSLWWGKDLGRSVQGGNWPGGGCGTLAV